MSESSTAAKRASTSRTSTSIRCSSRAACVEPDRPRARQRLRGFENNKYASGEFFDKYTNQVWEPATQKVRDLFGEAGIHIPNQQDWRG